MVVIVGSIGGFVYKKHKDQAHAASIEYKYGKHFQLRDSTKYRRLLVDGYACKWSSNTISVFSIRRGLITNAGYKVATSSSYSGGPRTSLHDFNNWLSNMNITRFSTVANGHNYMGYNSASLWGYAYVANQSYGSGDLVSLVHTSTLPACHY